jgi:hypothetical protein
MSVIMYNKSGDLVGLQAEVLTHWIVAAVHFT